MLSWLLMVLARTAKAVLFQCLRLSIGIIGVVFDLAGEIANSIYPIHRPMRTNVKSRYRASFNLPPFKVERKAYDYEVRHYHKAHWVSTASSGSPMSNSNAMFMKLLSYMQGSNKRNAMISMTVPVMTHFRNPDRSLNLKMSFYIPDDFQKDPPAPLDRSVFIEKKEFTAFVRSFGGYPMFSFQYRLQIDIMLKAMARDGVRNEYIKGMFMYASYDQPWKMFNRLNEVLLLRAKQV